MNAGLKKSLILVGAGFLLFLVLEAGIYNWRLILAMRYRNLAELNRQLSWQRDELLVEKAALLNPERLQTVGISLGLGPVPLSRVSVFDPEGNGSGGEFRVCMEQ